MGKDIFIDTQVGSYRIVTKLASGAFGSVYLAKHTLLENFIVAIKLLKSYTSSSEEIEDFLKEAEILAKLKHPYILPFLEFGILKDDDHDNIPYLITEYAPNGSLKDLIKRQSPSLLSTGQTIIILSQIGEALHHAHQQKIIHRDLKPDNILFNSQDHALLADFGIAMMITAASIKKGTLAGSPPYMAPEHFNGFFSDKGDQYSLGCIAYELFTGHKPFTASSVTMFAVKHATEQPTPPTHHNPNLPLYIEQAILKAMAKNRTERHSNVLAFLSVLSGSDYQATPSIITSSPNANGSEFYETQKSTVLWLEEGKNHFHAKRYEDAIIIYEGIIRLDPKCADAYYQKGLVFQRLERYEEALAAYDQAIYLDPNFALAYIGKGDISSSYSHYEDALKAYSDATRIAPNEALGYEKKAITFERLERYEEALAAYKSAILLHPTPTHILMRKAELLSILESSDEAITTYDQIIRIAPDFFEIYLRKIALLEQRQLHDEAITTYDQLIQRNPGNFDTYRKKIALLWRIEKYDKAITTYDQLIQLAPTSLDFYNEKIVLLKRLDMFNEIIASYDQIIQFIPRQSANFYQKKIDLLNELGRYDEVIITYDQIIDMAPNYTRAYYEKIVLLKQQKRYDEAIVVCDQIIEHDTYAFDAYFLKGMLLRRQKRYDEAILTYDQIIEKNANAFDAYYQKGRILEILGKQDEEHNWFFTTFGLNSLEPFAARLIIRFYFKEALIAYENAIQIHSDNSTFYIHKGDVLKYLGKLKQAEEAYKQANEIEQNNGQPNLHPQYMTEYSNGEEIIISDAIRNSKKYIFPLAFNYLIIPMILGLLLHSWLLLGVTMFCQIVLMLIIIGWLNNYPYSLFSGILWSLPASLPSFGWASIVWLLQPSNFSGIHIAFTSIIFLISFLGNTLLYLFIDIFFIGNNFLKFAFNKIKLLV